jgi:hypothetical protein
VHFLESINNWNLEDASLANMNSNWESLSVLALAHWAGLAVADLQAKRVWFEEIFPQVFLDDGLESLDSAHFGFALHFWWIFWSRDEASVT